MSINVLNDSGYPLPIAVHGYIDGNTTSHGWSVRYAEHQWSTRDGSRFGFADLVASNNLGVFAVLECKRVRDTEWLLFHSDGQRNNRRPAQAWLSQFHEGAFKRYGWSQLQIEPTCPEVHFCAVRGQSTSTGSTLLERTAAEVALATECIAQEHKDMRRGQTDIKVFFPVIVTTAKLRLATFDPVNISLADGTLQSAEFIDVPYVRFRKQLGVARAPSTSDSGSSGLDLASVKENTVFVVHAEAINDFLQDLDVHGAGLGSNPRAA